MQTVSPALQPVSPESSAIPKKLSRAAHQFEAILLNSLLGPMEKAFASVPGEKSMPGGDDYQYMATQALASALAASGGLGIAAMIVRNIMQHNGVRTVAAADREAKVLPSGDR